MTYSAVRLTRWVARARVREEPLGVAAAPRGVGACAAPRLVARLALAASAALLLCAASAAATPGLPRTYDVTPIESAAPLPGGGGNFGWGVTSADLTGDGKMELLAAQSQGHLAGAIFIYDGATNRHIDTLVPPEANPVNADGTPNPGEALAFIYVDHVADLGSCPAGDGPDVGRMCDDPRVGPQDGIPEIVAGSRALRVGTCPAGQTTCPQLGRTGVATDPPIGRAYVWDGRTRAVLKRIDMPLADRQSQVMRGNNGAAFGRLVMSPTGLPPCAGPRSEANNAGVGPCQFSTFAAPPPAGSPAGTPATEQRARAVEIGDADGIANDPDPTVAARGRADLFIAVRGYRETADPGLVNTAPSSSQCSNPAVGPAATSTAGACSSGRVFMFRGEEVSGSSTVEILDGTVDGQVPGGSLGIEPGPATETVKVMKNPFGQVAGQEYAGTMIRIGDVGRCAGPAPAPRTNECVAPTYLPDGKPDFVVSDRTVDSPFGSPTPSFEFADVGAAYLYDGATGLLLQTWTHPEPQPKGSFSDNFNSGWPIGDVGHTALPDYLGGAPGQNTRASQGGRSYVYSGDASGGRGSLISVLDDPTPQAGGLFGSAQTGVGDLVGGEANAGNEVMIGSFGPFSSTTDASTTNVPDVTIFSAKNERVLQTIPDPIGERGSGFGVGMTPMGDLNGDGFLDFSISSYVSNAPGNGADGRVYVFRSNDRPPPAAPSRPPGAEPSAPRLLRPGRCVNDTLGTAGPDVLEGTAAGDRMFGYGGDDVIEGFADDDCLDGGAGGDRLLGSAGADRLIGAAGGDRLAGAGDRDRLFGGGGADRLDGGYGADLLAGGAGNDRLDGGPETDRVYGEAGDDRIRSGGGRNILDGGAGDDVIYARNGRRDVVRCGSGADVVQADRTDSVQVDCERIGRAKG